MPLIDSTPPEETTRVRFGGVNPVFRVENLSASPDYSVQALGFAITWRRRGVES